jgi:hypothetical protein
LVSSLELRETHNLATFQRRIPKRLNIFLILFCSV